MTDAHFCGTNALISILRIAFSNSIAKVLKACIMARILESTFLKQYIPPSFLISLLLLFTCICCHGVLAQPIDQYSAVITRVFDGDTVAIKKEKEYIVLRLWGIDAPEKGQPSAIMAKKFLQKSILHKQVRIKELYLDDYNRTVAEIYYNDENISELLIQQGYAWVHPYYCKRPICDTWGIEERNARSLQIGLWRQSDPLPPWRWKQIHNRRKNK